MLLELDKKVELEIIDLALTHIKKVEADPTIKTDGDNFDYWNSYKLEDGNFVDYNIYCGDDFCKMKQDGSEEYEYTDPSEWSWDVCAYAVDPPEGENGHYQINTDIGKYLFSYNKEGSGKVEFE